jgi:hypothetical protein
MSLTLYGDNQTTGYGDGAWKETRGRGYLIFEGFWAWRGWESKKRKAFAFCFLSSFLSFHVGYGLLWLFFRACLPALYGGGGCYV